MNTSISRRFSGGMQTFLAIWTGQMVSLFGTAMTRFALLIWAYQQTGQATTLALLGFFGYITYLIASPISGIWVDRLDRRLVMLLADFGAGLITLGFLLLFTFGDLHIWHLYLGEALTGLFEGFQRPAYNAAVTTLVPREQLGRANGLRSLSLSVADVLGPVMGGLLLTFIGLRGIMVIDLLTFGVAAITLLSITVPRPLRSAEGQAAESESFWQQTTFGLRYIRQRQGLVGLVAIYMMIHLFAAMTYFGTMSAMVLARSGGSELALSSVQAALGIGGIVGGVILSTWGGPKRKIHGVLAYCAASFLLGDFFFAVGRTPMAWVTAGFLASFFIPFISSANREIWQSKVPQDIQGRVMSTSYATQQLTAPLGHLLGGPLADHIFEPGMMPGGALSGIFGGITGTGPGAGIGLMFLCTAILGGLTCLGGYLWPALRNVERDIPDANAAPALIPELATAAAD